MIGLLPNKQGFNCKFSNHYITEKLIDIEATAKSFAVSLRQYFTIIYF